MKKNILISLALLPATTFSNTYELQHRETVSELLYNRLQISPIYRNGFLKKVLEQNNLNEESARRLEPGTPIYVPTDMESEAVVHHAEEMLENAPVDAEPVAPEKIAIPTWWDHRIGLGFAAGQYKGDGVSSTSNYSISLGRPILNYEIFRNTEKTQYMAKVQTTFVSFPEDDAREGSADFFQAKAKLGYFYHFNPQFSLGVAGRFSQELYFDDLQNQTYKIHAPWVYAAGPQFRFNKNWILSSFFTPTQEVRSGLDSKSNYEVGLSYETTFMEAPIQLGVMYGDNSTEEMKGSQISGQFIYFFPL